MKRQRDAEAHPTCASCGRTMQPRRGDTAQPDARRYCSAGCRKRRVTRTDTALEEAILALLSARASGATICPSEAARAVAANADSAARSPAESPSGDAEDAWRALMEPARRAARRLVAAGRCEITQKGRVVDPSTAKGPIRVRSAR